MTYSHSEIQYSTTVVYIQGGTRNSAAFVTATLGLVPPKSG